MATRIDESRFLRNATSIGSCIATTSVAITGVQRAQPWAGASASALPTSRSSAFGCLPRKARQAGRTTDAP